MTYYEHRIGVETELLKELLRLDYDTLVKEFKATLAVYKHIDLARKLKIIPPELDEHDLAILLSAYRKAINMKEREMYLRSIERAKWRAYTHSSEVRI